MSNPNDPQPRPPTAPPGATPPAEAASTPPKVMPLEATPVPTGAAPRKVFTPAQIHSNARVHCSQGKEVGSVDHMQGAATVKLRKDVKGVHHYIPLAWVARIDANIHLDRPFDVVTREWSLTGPGQ